MARIPGETLSSGDLEVLAGNAQVEDLEDVDPSEWLARDESARTDYVQVGDRRMKVGIITQGEFERIQQASRTRVNPANPRGPRALDANLFARSIIAHAISKANGLQVDPEALKAKPTGDLIAIQKAVLRLSGFDEEQPSPESFFA